MSQSSFGYFETKAERDIGFLVLDSCNMMAFVSAVEPLRVANRVTQSATYAWHIISPDGNDVTASNGMTINASYSIKNAPKLDALFVYGPFFPESFSSLEVDGWLKKQAQNKMLIGGVETGCHVLAAAGLLDGYSVTTHWENMESLARLLPKGEIHEDIYEHDRNRITSAGGTSPVDMMLYLIEQHAGHEMAASVADQIIHPQRRAPSTPQRMDLKSRTGINHPGLLDCIELMENNIEQPLSPSELSELIGMSKRQLERLFRRYLNTTPARYYLTLRLHEAQRLVESSNMKIIDVAMSTGFKSAGHFSSRYLSCFGVTPRDTRKPPEAHS